MTLAAPFWLLLGIPMLALAAWYSRRHQTPVSRVAWLVASALVLTVALAGPQSTGRHSSRHMALVVDLSPGMLARIEPDALQAWCAQAVSELRAGDTLSLITVEHVPRVLLDAAVIPAADNPPLQIPPLVPVGHNQPGSNLAAAIGLALQRRPPHSVCVVRVLTDGAHTGSEDDIRGVRLMAAAQGVPMQAEPPPSGRMIADVGFLRAMAPQLVAPFQPFSVWADVRATVGARVAAEVARNGFALPGAHVTWQLGDQPLPMDPATGAVLLPAGLPCRVRVDVPGEESGFVAVGLSLRVLEGENRIAANDRIVAGTVVQSRRVLVVGQRDSDGNSPNFTRLLQRERPDLELLVRSPTDAPLQPADLLGFSAVVLDSVPRAAFGDRADTVDRALADAVEHGGPGLLMVGSRAFGQGGWIGSRVDEVLPVDCDPNRDVGAAVALVLDVSGSMREGARMPMTARAAQRLLEQCTPHDSVAVLTFNDVTRVSPPGTQQEPFVTVSPDSVAAVGAVLDQLVDRSELLTGETDLYAALDTALRKMQPRTDDARLILCLTDGEPTAGNTRFDAGFAGLIDRAASQDVFVAIICTAPIAAGSLLADLRTALAMRATSGRAIGSVQSVRDLAALPGEFTDRLAEARGPLIAPARPENWPILDATRKPVADTPALVGFPRTRLRDSRPGVAASLWGAGHEPLLATRRSGSGRSGAIMLPLDSTTLLGAGWRDVLTGGPRTDGESRVWQALWRTVDATLSGPEPARFSVDLSEADDGTLTVVARAESPLPDAIESGLQLRLQPGNDATAQEFMLHPVGPLRYECQLPADLAGSLLTGRLSAPDGSGCTVVLAVPLHREWRLLGINRQLLDDLNTLPARRAIDWLNAQVPPTSGRVDLTPWFATLAILLLVAGEVSRVWRHLVPRGTPT